MTTTRFPIGVSSYNDGSRTTPFGQMQFVIDPVLAMQLRSAAVEFDRDVLKNNGEHLTPNEGIRELPRQQELFDNHAIDPVRWALAATPGYSTHGPQIGTAVDFGITCADGTNRALTYAEFQALYAILARRGIVHTGAWFSTPEAWHCNGGYDASLPPITDAPLMGEDYTPNHSGLKPAPREAEGMKTMKFGSFWGALIGARIWKIDKLRVNGANYSGPTVLDLLQRVEASNPEKRAEFNDTQFDVIRAALKKFK